MLTLVEKVLFVLAALLIAYLTGQGAFRIYRTLRRAGGHYEPPDLPARLIEAGLKTLSQITVFRSRPWPSLAHAFVAWAFMYYLLVNIGDGLEGYISNFVFLGEGVLGNVYRLIADLLSVGALAGITALLIRRATAGRAIFSFRETTKVYPNAQKRIRRDSLVVGIFILFHVGFRFLGSSFHLAEIGPDPWLPFASLVSRAWAGLSPAAVAVMQHVAWWVALGLILVFFPYFLYSKHLHIFFSPLNFLFKPRRPSIGALDKVDFDDESITQYGAARLEHLPWPQVMDAYACIMCNRCQDACPAYATGKALSPAALEINKRLFLNDHGAALAAGGDSPAGLMEFALNEESLWACTACGACIEICPVGNEPMRDILDIRRNQVLMENAFPAQLQQAFRGMERLGNPWNVAPDSRLDWANGLHVPTLEQNPEPELLWWVGCAPATEARAQKTARDFAKILNAAGVNFAVLGRHERCTGDSARRSGNEALFFELATGNVERLNEALGEPRKRIVATCPHCLHTLANEYPQFGGNYEVIHHTQLIAELFAAGKLKTNAGALGDPSNVTFHDPCYLGRHNGVYDAPRDVLARAGAQVAEMPRARNGSFCCGAGGAQMWKEEEPGAERVSANRFREAQATGAKTLTVGCPFCMIMLTDAARAANSDMQVRDVAEVVAEGIGEAGGGS